MKYVINIDEDNPISVTDREIVYMDNETGMTWTISKNGKKKMKPLKEHETQMVVKIPDVIRRKDAIDAFMDLPNCPNGYSDTYDKASIIGVLEDVTSVQDEIAKAVAAVIEQPKIIRCKDCKHNPKESLLECPMSFFSEERRPETAWCWKGERKIR